MSERNSSRVLARSLKQPSIVEVIVVAPGF